MFFFSPVNYADFHRAQRVCFIPKLLICSEKYAVVQSFDFTGKPFKKMPGFPRYKTTENWESFEKKSYESLVVVLV